MSVCVLRPRGSRTDDLRIQPGLVESRPDTSDTLSPSGVLGLFMTFELLIGHFSS